MNKGLSWLQKLGWTKFKARRMRGDLILTFQFLNHNAELNLKIWYKAQPISYIHGPASSVRANTVRLNPPVQYRCKQREHFFTSRIAAPLREQALDIMNFRSVNSFKNAYDETKIQCQHQ